MSKINGTVAKSKVSKEEELQYLEDSLIRQVRNQRQLVDHTAKVLIKMVEEFQEEASRALEPDFLAKNPDLSTYEVTGWGINHLLSVQNNMHLLEILRHAKDIEDVRFDIHRLKAEIHADKS